MVHTSLLYELVDDLPRRPALRQEHLEKARQSLNRGDLVLAGALADPVDQAGLVFRGDSTEAAEAFAKADPYVKNGLVKS